MSYNEKPLHIRLGDANRRVERAKKAVVKAESLLAATRDSLRLAMEEQAPIEAEARAFAESVKL